MSDVDAKLAAVEPEEDAARDEALDTLWTLALAEWDEPKRHGALLELALGTNRLPELAGRYRGLLGDPEKGAVAKKRLDAIVIAATQLLMSTASTRTKTKTSPLFMVLAILFFLFAFAWLGRLMLRLYR